MIPRSHTFKVQGIGKKVQGFTSVWLPRCQNALSRMWDHWSVVYGAWLVSVSFLFLSLWTTPEPGMASMVCGAFIAVAVLREMGKAQKLLCALTVLLFVRVELTAIRQDREEDQKHFGEIVNRLTGGDSYALITPNTFTVFIGPDGRPGFPLMITNCGNYPLTGTTINFAKTKPQGVIDDPMVIYAQPTYFVQALPRNSKRTIDYLYPDLTNGKVQSYEMWITAPNGQSYEQLSVRSGSRGLEYKYFLQKGIIDWSKKPLDPQPGLVHSDWTQ